MLSHEQRARLLSVARESLRHAVGKGPAPDLTTDDPDLTRDSGAFVTLEMDGHLRGCIGYIEAIAPLIETVARMARAAALEDPRFDPVDASDEPRITIEISVMSPLVKVASLSEVVVGRDGLMIRAVGRSGVFLPQVPVEWRWNKQQYLEELGVKAGLGRDGYKRKDAEFWRFTAQVFKER